MHNLYLKNDNFNICFDEILTKTRHILLVFVVNFIYKKNGQPFFGNFNVSTKISQAKVKDSVTKKKFTICILKRLVISLTIPTNPKT